MQLIVSDAEAALLAGELFGIRGDARRLIGEYDQNFRVRDTQGKRYVLKFTPPHIGIRRVEFQNSLLVHLAAQAPDLRVPRLIRTRAGDPLWLDEPRGGLLVRMLAWVDGTSYCDYEPKTAALRRSLGVFVAKLTDALDSFEYGDAPRGHMWDLARADQHRSLSRLISDSETRQRIEAVFERFSNQIRPALETLPRRAVHGDINDSNVLVDHKARDEADCGLIDFGDAGWSHAVCELAISATYACVAEEHPREAIADVVHGYAAVRELSVEEEELVIPLVEARLAVSLCVSARRRSSRPGEAHLQSSAGQAAATLARLAR